MLSWYHNRFNANDDNEYGDYRGWIGTMGCYAQCNMRIGQAGLISTLHTFALFVSLAHTHSSRGHGYIFWNFFPKIIFLVFHSCPNTFIPIILMKDTLFLHEESPHAYTAFWFRCGLLNIPPTAIPWIHTGIQRNSFSSVFNHSQNEKHKTSIGNGKMN